MEQSKRVIALGFFDGVHLGHAALLRRAAQRAEALDAIPTAMTFDVHPGEVIMNCGQPLLTTPEQRTHLMEELCGIRELIITPFDNEMMHMNWKSFVTELLISRHGAVHLVVGHDYRFGYMGEGTPARLQELCAELGLGCDVIEPVRLDGITVSSTYIRTLVAQGEMERAARFLGHPYCMTDIVRHGKKLGSRLGFPTANLHVPPRCVVPAFGVYAARICVDGECYAAAVNVGMRPTVEDGESVTVEGTLLDFDGSLYGKSIRVEFLHRLRSEVKFDTLDDLRAQVHRDIDCVRSYFSDHNRL